MSLCLCDRFEGIDYDSQIATQRGTVRAGQLEVEQSIGQRPAGQRRCRGACGIKGTDQTGEVEVLDLLIT
ncbi:hypothetical protein, partial [Candidatus Propionivibrio aalborgensis]|uniref:hypothetical protein n=1 Tax=Candidatus Propionivibrio aalborgensis TaxID=1860101 RepID=UPI001C922B82